jgi:hypothetical protein
MSFFKLITFFASNCWKRIPYSILQMMNLGKYNRIIMTIHNICPLILQFKPQFKLLYKSQHHGFGLESPGILNFIIPENRYEYCIRELRVSSVDKVNQSNTDLTRINIMMII